MFQKVYLEFSKRQVYQKMVSVLLPTLKDKYQFWSIFRIRIYSITTSLYVYTKYST